MKLKEQIKKIREKEELKKRKKEKKIIILETRHKNNITYQKCGINCGKCNRIHRAYWLAKYRDGSGKVRTIYIGKRLQYIEDGYGRVMVVYRKGKKRFIREKDDWFYEAK